MKTTAPRIAIISYSTQLRYAAYINHQVYARTHGYDYIFDLAASHVNQGGLKRAALFFREFKILIHAINRNS